MIIVLFSLTEIFSLDTLDNLLNMFKTDYQQNIDNKNNIIDMRKQAKQILDNDLIQWEKEWESYRPREAFSRFVADKPPAVQGVFWDQFNYMQAKVDAGRSAYSNAMISGKSAEQARQAYYDAAATRHVELIEVNKNANIRHGLANAQEQELFHNNNGKYIYRFEP